MIDYADGLTNDN